MDLGELFDLEGRRRHRDRRDHGDDSFEHRDAEYPDAGQGRQRRTHNDHGDKEECLDFGSFRHPLSWLLAHEKSVVLSGMLLGLLLVAIGILVLPWGLQAAEYINKSGAQGLIGRLWKGSGS